MKPESEILEYKSKFTEQSLKSVSAFANTKGGQIIFGIDDKTLMPTKKLSPLKVSQNLERRINDCLSPIPDYKIEMDEANQLVKLKIEEGLYKPYFFEQIAYIRKGTSSIPMDALILARMMLEHEHLTYDQLPSRQEDYSFSILEKEVLSKLGLEQLGSDSLKSLQLLTKDNQLTVAGALLSDQNNFPGIDISPISGMDLIGERRIIDKVSILQMLYEAVEIFNRYYRKEKIGGIERHPIFLIPETAFREAVANALIHRTWDTFSNIIIKMYEDKIEIISPGGLPAGITQEEYLNRNLSVPRNVILSEIFYRLGYIEKLGTGIGRIKRAYSHQFVQPSFEISENSLTITLPILNQGENLSTEEEKVLNLIKTKKQISRAQISENLDFSRAKTVRILNKLLDRKIIAVEGRGRNTVYTSKI